VITSLGGLSRIHHSSNSPRMKVLFLLYLLISYSTALNFPNPNKIVKNSLDVINGIHRIAKEQVAKIPSMDDINREAAAHAQYAQQVIADAKAKVSANLPSMDEINKQVEAHAQHVQEVIEGAKAQAATYLPSLEELKKKSMEGIQGVGEKVGPALENAQEFVTSQASEASKIITSYLTTLQSNEVTVVQVASDCLDWSAEKLAEKLGIPEETARKAIIIVVGIAVGVTVAYVVIPGILGGVGFTAEGVSLGSLAASAQSFVYGGETSGVFSFLQSAGALGVDGTTAFIISTFGGATTAYASSHVEHVL